jgi:histidine triad (HIT) family protein
LFAEAAVDYAYAGDQPREGLLMFKIKSVVVSLLFLSIGLVSGGILFSQSQPRSVLALQHCDQCFDVKDLAGLLASIGIQKFPGLLPAVVAETDRTIALKLPTVKQRVHYVIIPKKDIKNIGDMAVEDAPYLIDIFAVAQHIIAEKGLTNYQIITNGPGYQDVTYLHFHLLTK